MAGMMSGVMNGVMNGAMSGMSGMMGRIDRLRRYAGLLLAGALLLIYVLGIVVYSTAGVVPGNGDLADPKKLLPAVAARPAGFVLIGLGYLVFGAAAWFLMRTLRAVSGRTLERYLRPAVLFGALAFVFYVIYGLYIAIRLPWLASGYARAPLTTADAFLDYAHVSDALLGAANVALGGSLLFACLGLIREKTFSRYLTLLGMFWGLTAVASPFPQIEAPIIQVLGQLCGFFWALGMGFALLRPASDMQETMPMKTPMAPPEARRRNEPGLPHRDTPIREPL